MNFFNFLNGGIKKDGKVVTFDPNSFNPNKLTGFIQGLSESSLFSNKQSEEVETPNEIIPNTNQTFNPKFYEQKAFKNYANGHTGNILSLVAKLESGNNPYKIAGGAIDKSLTSSTIGQLSKRYGGKALGRYQIQMPTAKMVLKKNGIDPTNYKFDEEGQENIANMLLVHRGYGKIKDINKLARNLSMEWAALPKDKSNTSYYQGVQGNKALTDYATVIQTLKRT